MKQDDFYQWQDDNLTLKIYAQPNAKKNEIIGLHNGALKIRIAAPSLEGKANAELINFLAGWLAVPKSTISLLQGAQGRYKRILVVQCRSGIVDLLQKYIN